MFHRYYFYYLSEKDITFCFCYSFPENNHIKVGKEEERISFYNDNGYWIIQNKARVF